MFKCFLTIYFFGQFLYFSQRLKSINQKHELNQPLFQIIFFLPSLIILNYSFLVICYPFLNIVKNNTCGAVTTLNTFYYVP